MKCKHGSNLHAKPVESVKMCLIIVAISVGSLKRLNRLRECSSTLADAPICSFRLPTIYYIGRLHSECDKGIFKYAQLVASLLANYGGFNNIEMRCTRSKMGEYAKCAVLACYFVTRNYWVKRRTNSLDILVAHMVVLVSRCEKFP